MILGLAVIAASLTLIVSAAYSLRRNARRRNVVASAKQEIDDLYKQANRQMRKALTDWLDQK